MPFSNLFQTLFFTAETYLALGYAPIPLYGDADPSRPKVAAVPWLAYQKAKPSLDQCRDWFLESQFAAIGIVTGMVAGLGTITPASGYVGPMGALLIGGAAGIICFFATNYMKRALHIDDSLDVFPVHGVGGILGTFLAGVFAFTLGGLGPTVPGTTMGQQIMVQLTGIGVTILWSGILTFVLLKLVDVLIGLRVPIEQETEGLDLAMHNETGYNL